jgi:hypothetical protein
MGSEHPMEERGARVSAQPRPLSLLIACGTVLATRLLIVIGLVAGYLRRQTLQSSEAGLLCLDSVLVAKSAIAALVELGVGTWIAIRPPVEQLPRLAA